MALEKVVENIREEGRRQAEARLAEARKEAAAILADAEKQAASVRERRLADLKSAQDALQRREVAAAELEAKKARLNAEKEVLARVREAVLDRLGKLPGDKRIQHIQSLVRTSSISGGKVLVAERDADAARKAGLAVAGTAPVIGGVIIVSADGSTSEDLTYETLLDEVWGRSLHDVAGTLFGKAK